MFIIIYFIIIIKDGVVLYIASERQFLTIFHSNLSSESFLEDYQVACIFWISTVQVKEWVLGHIKSLIHSFSSTFWHTSKNNNAKQDQLQKISSSATSSRRNFDLSLSV